MNIADQLPLATSWKAVFRTKANVRDEQYYNFGRLVNEAEAKVLVKEDLEEHHKGYMLIRVSILDCRGDDG